MAKRMLAVLIALMLMCGCANAQSTKPLARQGFMLNTVISISLYDNQDEAILDGAFALCEEYEQLFSRTISTSDVYRINHSIWDGIMYDQLIDDIKSTTDFVEREAMMHRAEDILMDTGAIVPIYYYNDLYMMKPTVEGFYANVYGTKYFTYCTNGDSDTLRINLASEPDYIDPALNSSVDGALCAHRPAQPSRLQSACICRVFCLRVRHIRAA